MAPSLTTASTRSSAASERGVLGREAPRRTPGGTRTDTHVLLVEGQARRSMFALAPRIPFSGRSKRAKSPPPPLSPGDGRSDADRRLAWHRRSRCVAGVPRRLPAGMCEEAGGGSCGIAALRRHPHTKGKQMLAQFPACAIPPPVQLLPRLRRRTMFTEVHELVCQLAQLRALAAGRGDCLRRLLRKPADDRWHIIGQSRIAYIVGGVAATVAAARRVAAITSRHAILVKRIGEASLERIMVSRGG
eukprot:364271-Chlamydomonas_euryale.AAC.8